MARTIDIPALKTRSANAVSHAMKRCDDAVQANPDYMLHRWMARMTAVEIHSIWERYVEQRLVAGLNHDPTHFLSSQDINGVTRVSSGLAYYVVRSGGRFFDFRSMSDVIDKANRWLGKPKNTFKALPAHDRSYLDALASIRNCIVHGSDAAQASYRRTLKSLYGITSAPGVDEFLNAKDSRQSSPARSKARLHGLAAVVSRAIQNT